VQRVDRQSDERSKNIAGTRLDTAALIGLERRELRLLAGNRATIQGHQDHVAVTETHP
jgi:hypothetical protein